MITLKIKISTDGKTYTSKHFLDDAFPICKTNEELAKIVEGTIKEASLPDVDKCIVTASFEW